MRWKRLILMLLFVGLVFGGVYGFILFRNQMIADFFANQPRPVIAVTATEAVSERWHTTVPAIGTLRAVNGVNVTPAVGGVVQEISFQSGQRVSQGDPLVQLDADIEEANLAAAQARFQFARANQERVGQLAPGSTVSQARIDEVRFELETQEAQVAALQAQIDKKTVRAPFDGIVGIRQIDIGEYVQPGTAIVNLQDLSTLLVDFSVGQRDLAVVSAGRPIQIRADADPDAVFEGTVTSIEPRVDPATGLVAVEGSLPNPNGVLRPGMFVNVEVGLADARDVVVVPQTSISFNLYGDYVYVVDPPAEGAEHPTVRRVVVRTGERRDGNVVIQEGVAAGETVVTSGQLRLSNGAQIDVTGAELERPPVTDQPY